MEVKSYMKKYKCDECDKDGVIIYDEHSSKPVHKEGTWFKFNTQGCGEPEDFCSLECVFKRIRKIEFNLQIEVAIELSIIIDGV